MKGYGQLSIRYLKSQKKRSILTVIGIILSVSLLCAAGIMGESLKNQLKDEVKHMYGNNHVTYTDINEQQINKLKNNIKVDKVGYKLDAGMVDILKSQRLSISACDKNCLDMLYIKLALGRLPEKENEIVLEQWIVDNMKDKPGIDSTIRLDIQVQGTEKSSKISKGFKLVGILKNTDKSFYYDYSIGVVTIETAKSILNTENMKMQAAVLIKDKLPLQASINEISKSIDAKKEQIHQNTAVLVAEGQGKNNQANNAVMIIEAILVAVIIITTIAVIYNSFHISVLERVHQFGVLRSIGTTPKQIRAIVLGEAGILSAIGIPLGILAGILAVKCVIGIFSIQSTEYFGGMQVIVPIPTVLLYALLGLVTIILSAFGPAISASRVSPMEAILNKSKSDKIKRRRKKNPLLKLLRVEIVMAYENLRRNKKRLFVTVFSMSIGIALYIFFSNLINLIDSETNVNFQKNFCVQMPFSSQKSGYTEKDYNEISKLPGVKTVYRVMQRNQTALVTDKQVSDKYKEMALKEQKNRLYNYENKNYFTIPTKFYGYRDLELKLCKSSLIRGNINIDAINAENGILVSQNLELPDESKIECTKLKVGDKILLKTDKKVVVLKVLGILDKMPLSYKSESEMYGIITTEKVFKEITGIDTFTRFDIEVERSADNIAIKRKFQEVAYRVKEGVMHEYSSDSYNIQIKVILFGLVIVISIIGALNIINTINTNLILRVREFGTIRAIGMTPLQIKIMIGMEGLFYGLIASFYGSIAGILLSRLLYINFNTIKGISWHTPWLSAIQACIAAIIIGLAASAAPLKRISQMNVVESIRAEE